jgi:cyclooctat-9-en-7-ol 5-monooxygenase
MGFLGSLSSLGGVVQIGLGRLPVYMVTDPAMVHEMLVTKAGHFEKGLLFDKARALIGSGIITSAGEFHLRQRRLIQPAFHPDRIADYSQIMVEYAETLARSWKPQQTLDLQSALDELAQNIVVSALFSAHMYPEAIAEIKRSFPIVMRGIAIRTLLPFDAWQKLPLPAVRRFGIASARMRQVLDEVVAAYCVSDPATTAQGSLLSVILGSRDAGQGMSQAQARDELVSLIAAASETTASTLGSLFLEVARHPEIEQRLHAELDTVLGGRTISPGDLARLSYTRRLVTETLRLHSPGWLFMRRSIRSVQIGGTRIPAGSELAYSPRAMHRNPALYPEPLKFDPDRWVDRPVRALPRGAYIPFAEGNRQCIGNEFAVTEMIAAVAALCSRWRLVETPAGAHRHVYRTVVRLDHLTVRAVPRDVKAAQQSPPPTANSPGEPRN